MCLALRGMLCTPQWGFLLLLVAVAAVEVLSCLLRWFWFWFWVGLFFFSPGAEIVLSQLLVVPEFFLVFGFFRCFLCVFFLFVFCFVLGFLLRRERICVWESPEVTLCG